MELFKHYYKANVLFNLKRYEEALEAINRALKLDSHLKDSINLKGRF